MIATTTALLLLQTPTALASTTSDTDLPNDPVVADEDWFRREAGVPGAWLYLPGESQKTLLGDLDADGLFDVHGDVDALCWHPRAGGTGPSPFDVLYSTLTNGPGYEDGDLIRFDTSQGLQVVVSEADFVGALQPASGGFDLDGAACMGADEFWISVSGDLTGTVLGDVDDGDILVYDRSAGTIRREYSEADVQTMVDNALGAPASSIGDVLALSFYPPTGELVFSVQSESAYDASVFGIGGGGRILAGWEEADWGFGGAAELDALCFVPTGLPTTPVLQATPNPVAPNSPLALTVRHGTPGGVAEGYLALGIQFVDRPGQGVGFSYLDLMDPVFRRLYRHGRTHPQMLNAQGQVDFSWTTPALPAAVTHMDVYLQVVDRSSQGISPPLRVRIQ